MKYETQKIELEKAKERAELNQRPDEKLSYNITRKGDVVDMKVTGDVLYSKDIMEVYRCITALDADYVIVDFAKANIGSLCEIARAVKLMEKKFKRDGKNLEVRTDELLALARNIV